MPYQIDSFSLDIKPGNSARWMTSWSSKALMVRGGYLHVTPHPAPTTNFPVPVWPTCQLCPDRSERLPVINPSVVSHLVMQKHCDRSLSNLSQQNPVIMSENQDHFLWSSKSSKCLSILTIGSQIFKVRAPTIPWEITFLHHNWGQTLTLVRSQHHRVDIALAD